jgi:hypothetical protein
MGGQLGGNTFYAQRTGPGTALAIQSSFGGAGGVLGVASADLYAGAAAMDPEGGVYVGGAGTSGGETPVLGHVNAAGQADLGDAGWCALSLNVQFDLGFQSLVPLPDGRLWAIGSGSDSQGGLPYIVRTTGGCAYDPTWNGGAAFHSLTNTSVEYEAMAAYPAPDGRIVVVGSDPGVGFYAARYWP